VQTFRAILIPFLFLVAHRASAQDSLLIAQADTLFAHQDWKAARKIYDRIITDGDAPARAYHKRGVCKDRLGADREDVMADINEALRRDPRYFKALLFRARVYSKILMFQRSIDDLNVAMECAPDTAGLVDCLTERGTAYCDIRSFDPAIADFRRALELDSTAYAAYGRLANTLEEIGQREEALKMQIRYTELVPDDWTGYMNTGFYLGNMGRYAEALTWYDKAWEHGGATSPLIWNNRGYAKYKLGDLKGALKDIRKSLELQSWNSYAYRNLALVHIAQGKKDDACTALEDAIKWGFTEQYGDEVKQLYATHCK
jgi:tetratricopeptide (TPR) repeat protein